MKSTLALLLAGSALVAALGLPSLAAMRGTGDASGVCTAGACAAVYGEADRDMRVIRVSDNDDEDDDDDDDEDDDDEDRGTGAGANPAPAGTVPPPANGLFGNGAPPVAVTN